MTDRPASSLMWRQCVCGSWYWGAPQTDADIVARAAPQADATANSGEISRGLAVALTTFLGQPQGPVSPPPELTAEEFWRGKCLDCGHPEHEMTCHETVPNGDPSNGPTYCPCASMIESMEQEILRLRLRADPR